MKNNKLYIIAALLGVALVGCEKEELYSPNDTPEPQTWKLVVQATKSLESKALELSGTSLNACWELEEAVDVFFEGTRIGTLNVTSVDTDGDVATLSGKVNIPEGLTAGDKLTLLFPGREDHKWDYRGQDGSIGTIANQFDYAFAELTVSGLNSSTNEVLIETGRADFENEQSVYRLTFKVNNAAIPVESIVLTSAEDKLVSERTCSEGTWTSSYGALYMDPASAPADDYYYMAIRNENDGSTNNYTFSAVGTSDNAYYEGTKTISKALANGKFYNANINIGIKDFSTVSGSVSAEGGVL